MTALVERDPLAPNLLASRAAVTTVSTDIPSTGATRPFGLTQGQALADDEAMVSLDGSIYDSVRQLSVDSTGRPFVEIPYSPQMGTTSDTQFDMTWVVDRD